MAFKREQAAESCEILLQRFHDSYWATERKLVTLCGVDGRDVYNPSVPFALNGRTLFAGRVEARDSERAETRFFEERDGAWLLCPNAPVFELQDPFVAFAEGNLIVGGVRVIWEGEKIAGWVTDFYRGRDLDSLEHFLTGPMNMKDIRLIELADGSIGIFSRPHGEHIRAKYGTKAIIGFTTAQSLKHITPELIEKAPYLEGMFAPGEWGGCNQLHLLKDGRIGAVGHISRSHMEEDVEHLHYYSMAFTLDPSTRERSRLEIIGARSMFPPGPAKEARLADVVFTAGLVRFDDGTADLYAGLSDCQIGSVRIRDPFDNM